MTKLRLTEINNATEPLNTLSTYVLMTVITNPSAIDNLLNDFARTTDEIFSLEELRKLLLSGKQLRMKYGVDVTAPNLHIGHAVNLWMYRRLQELGHKVIFLIGDFTTQIGDPTGKNKTRPTLPEEEIRQNAQAFIDQAFMVLHQDSHLVEVRRNTEWFSSMSIQQLLSLLSTVTHGRLVSRDMFRRRMEDGDDIYMHELIYPILQGYDSVELKADLTIIGSDQLFNEMMGRLYQEKFGQSPQVIVTTKITPGIDGKHKQSKSLNNYIGLGHTPREKFGRIMSIPDELIVQYLEVYTDLPMEEIRHMRNRVTNKPMECKLDTAEAIVARYHGVDIGHQERGWFVQTFSQRQMPDDIPTIKISSVEPTAFEVVRACLDTSVTNSEIRRLFLQGAIGAGHDVVKEINQHIPLPINIRIGKRKWFKVEAT